MKKHLGLQVTSSLQVQRSSSWSLPQAALHKCCSSSSGKTQPMGLQETAPTLHSPKLLSCEFNFIP